MFISILKAEYITDYQLRLYFDNGKEGIVDLKETIFTDHRVVFETLKNVDFFKNFSLDSWTVTWSNGLDLAPEFLYNLMLEQAKKSVEINTTI